MYSDLLDGSGFKPVSLFKEEHGVNGRMGAPAGGIGFDRRVFDEPVVPESDG